MPAFKEAKPGLKLRQYKQMIFEQVSGVLAVLYRPTAIGSFRLNISTCTRFPRHTAQLNTPMHLTQPTFSSGLVTARLLCSAVPQTLRARTTPSLPLPNNRGTSASVKTTRGDNVEHAGMRFFYG